MRAVYIKSTAPPATRASPAATATCCTAGPKASSRMPKSYVRVWITAAKGPGSNGRKRMSRRCAASWTSGITGSNRESERAGHGLTPNDRSFHQNCITGRTWQRCCHRFLLAVGLRHSSSVGGYTLCMAASGFWQYLFLGVLSFVRIAGFRAVLRQFPFIQQDQKRLPLVAVLDYVVSSHRSLCRHWRGPYALRPYLLEIEAEEFLPIQKTTGCRQT